MIEITQEQAEIIIRHLFFYQYIMIPIAYYLISDKINRMTLDKISEDEKHKKGVIK
ncbi:hypothetical protein AB6C49_18630 [Vibrio cyclitrophicus]